MKSNTIITYTAEKIAEARDRAAMAAMVDIDSFLLALDDIEHLQAELEDVNRWADHYHRQLIKAIAKEKR